MVIIGVSDETAAKIEPYVKDNKINWLIASDPGGKTMREYGAKGYPTAYLIDAKGKLVWTRHPTQFPEDQLKEILKDVKSTDSKAEPGEKPSSGEKPKDGDKKDE